MRQAGRYLPGYHDIRGDDSVLDVARNPKQAADMTALPLRHLDVDAAVLYSDLSTPFLGAGVDVEIRSGIGPYVEDPVDSREDLDRLEPFDSEEALPFVTEQIDLLTERLDVPVVGFVGGPFTLCSYLVEAPKTRRLKGLKSMMWSQPDLWDDLLGYWADQLAEFGIAQYEAGAEAIQVFDSWAGSLGAPDYREHVQPHSARLLETLEEAGVPTIHFPRGNPAILPDAAEAGGDAISVDWLLPLDEAWDAIGTDKAIQGNLDPTALLAGEDVARRKTRDVLEAAGGRPGHVFNLGHGVLPETDHEVLQAVVDEVHAWEGDG
jgi:uroporphyrinogen decarboxylase